jgi:hypothetical protein
VKRQQIAQRVNGHVNRRAPLALPTAIAGTLDGLGLKAQRPTIDVRGRNQRGLFARAPDRVPDRAWLPASKPVTITLRGWNVAPAQIGISIQTQISETCI